MNPLLGFNRRAIFDAALRAAPGSRVVDEGCPLTLFADRTVEVGMAIGHGRQRGSYRRGARVFFVKVNVDTHAVTGVV